MGAILLTVVFFVLYALGFVLLAKVWLGATWRAGYRLHRPDRPDVPVPEEPEPPRWRMPASSADEAAEPDPAAGTPASGPG